MRCYCCNSNLNDYESTLKSAETGLPLDTCNKCLKGLGINTVARLDLKKDEAAPADWLDVGDMQLFDKVDPSFFDED